MSTVKEIFKRWLPDRFKVSDYVLDYIDSAGQILEELHEDIGKFSYYLSPRDIPEEYIADLENYFNIPLITGLTLQQRRERILYVVDYIRVKGIYTGFSWLFFNFELDYDIIEKWSEDYETFYEEPQGTLADEGGMWFKTPHIDLEIFFYDDTILVDDTGEIIFEGVGVSFSELMENFHKLRPVDVVLDNTIFNRTINDEWPYDWDDTINLYLWAKGCKWSDRFHHIMFCENDQYIAYAHPVCREGFMYGQGSYWFYGLSGDHIVPIYGKDYRTYGVRYKWFYETVAGDQGVPGYGSSGYYYGELEGSAELYDYTKTERPYQTNFGEETNYSGINIKSFYGDGTQESYYGDCGNYLGSLLSNEGLERWTGNDPDGWTVGSDHDKEDGHVKTGSYAVKVSTDTVGALKTIDQLIPFVLDQDYKLVIWYRRLSGTVIGVLQDAGETGDYLQSDGIWGVGPYFLEDSTSEGWQKIEIIFTGPSTQSTAAFKLGVVGSGSVAVFDSAYTYDYTSLEELIVYGKTYDHIYNAEQPAPISGMVHFDQEAQYNNEVKAGEMTLGDTRCLPEAMHKGIQQYPVEYYDRSANLYYGLEGLDYGVIIYGSGDPWAGTLLAEIWELGIKIYEEIL